MANKKHKKFSSSLISMEILIKAMRYLSTYTCENGLYQGEIASAVRNMEKKNPIKLCLKTGSRTRFTFQMV